MSNQLLWWGYLHSSGSVVTKRWGGDVRDYTTDCDNNPFVLLVVPPFEAENRQDAERKIVETLKGSSQ